MKWPFLICICIISDKSLSSSDLTLSWLFPAPSSPLFPHYPKPTSNYPFPTAQCPVPSTHKPNASTYSTSHCPHMPILLHMTDFSITWHMTHSYILIQLLTSNFLTLPTILRPIPESWPNNPPIHACCIFAAVFHTLPSVNIWDYTRHISSSAL